MKAKRTLIVILAILLVATVVSAVACKKHTHQYTKWAHNDTQHYKVCPDDNVADTNSYADHVYDQENGTKCVCGKEKPVEPCTEHSYTDQPFVKDQANAGKHYRNCSKCGQPGESVNCTTFTYSASATVGKHTATCSDCGYTVAQDHAYTQADDKCLCGEKKPCEHDYTGQPYVADPEQKGKHYQICKLCQEARKEGDCETSITSHIPSNHTIACSLCTYEAQVAHDYTSGNKFNTCECGEVHEEYFLCINYTLGDETDPWTETTTVRERIFDDEGDGMHVLEFEFTQPCEFVIKKNLEGEWDSVIKFSTFDVEVYSDEDDLITEGTDGRFKVKYACVVSIYISLEDEVIEIEVESVTPTAQAVLSVPAGGIDVELEAVIKLPSYVFENKDIYVER